MPEPGNPTQLAPLTDVQARIHTVRGQRILLDSYLPHLYGVTTNILNRAVSRNKERFPDDFMFQLTSAEADALRFQFGTSNAGRGGRRYMPYAFTEQGIAMLSGVLRSPQAVQVNVAIMRAFVAMRASLTDGSALMHRILALEQKYDGQFETVFAALRRMMGTPPAPTRRMGFRQPEEEPTQ